MNGKRIPAKWRSLVYLPPEIPVLDIVKKGLAFGLVAAVGFALLQGLKRVPVVGPYVAKLGV